MPSGVKRTHKDYIKLLADKFPHVKCLGRYTKMSDPIDHECLNCKHKWKSQPDWILRSPQGCPGCGKRRGMHLDSYKEELRKRRGDEVIVLSKTYDAESMKFRHSCGYEWDARPRVTIFGTSCPQCAGRQQKTHPQYVKDLRKVFPEIKVVGTYLNAVTSILHRHSCGHEWKVRPNSLLKGTSGCPCCGMKMKVVKIKGRTMALRGYEPQALKLLIKEGYDVRDIRIDSENKTPRIHYNFKDGRHIYRPDFYLKKEKLIVEVKSKATLGLEPYPFRNGLSASDLFNKTKAKARRCMVKGYAFRLIVLDKDGRELGLPHNWWSMKRCEVMRNIR